jgi:hypothetical protein
MYAALFSGFRVQVSALNFVIDILMVIFEDQNPGKPPIFLLRSNER